MTPAPSSLSTTTDEESGVVMLANGTLDDGSEGFDWLCLPDGCYELIVGGGAESELDEIGFEFIDEIGGHFQDLAAPYADHFCVAAGDVFDHPTVSPTISVPPTALPVPEPTISAAPTVFTSAPTVTVKPSPVPTTAPTTPAPTPSPTPSPTRTPVVAVSVGISGIACADFNGTVYNLALGSLLNGSFSAPTCTDLSGSAVQVDNQATVSLVDSAAYGERIYGYGISAHAHVAEVLNRSVTTGSFTSAIVTFATQLGQRRLSTAAVLESGSRRRLSMSAASVDSVSVDTFSPTPAPTETPTTPPSPAPSARPTAVPVPAPSALPTAVPVPAPTTLPTSFPTSKPAPLPTPLPTSAPTLFPTTALPAPAPTALPTLAPTPAPTTTAPTTTPTAQPTVAPTQISRSSSSAGINSIVLILGAAAILVCGVGIMGIVFIKNMGKSKAQPAQAPPTIVVPDTVAANPVSMPQATVVAAVSEEKAPSDPLAAMPEPAAAPPPAGGSDPQFSCGGMDIQLAICAQEPAESL
jgi:outer membrane biosynthesis protein TonB